MLGKNAALRHAFFSLLTLSSAAHALVAAPAPQDVRSTSPARVLQTAPARTAQSQVCLRQVPDLSRYNAGSVGAILAKVDLVFGSTRPQKSTAPKGAIVGQSEKPGTQVRCGTRIDVYVSDGTPVLQQTGPGPADGWRKVPPTSDGGPPSSTSDGPPANSRRPIPHDRPLPDSDAQQPRPDLCSVPSLTSYSLVDLRERLRGWTIGRVEKVETRAAREGTILKQSPAPRSLVKCNSSIDIAVAVAPPIVVPPTSCVVPGIESGDVAGARLALARRNLVLGNVNTRPREVAWHCDRTDSRS